MTTNPTAERIAEMAIGTVKDLLEQLAAAQARIADLEEDRNHWKVKATAYGTMVHGCSPALKAAGHPVDASGPGGGVEGVRIAVEALVAERDAAVKRIAELEGMATEGFRTLHDLARADHDHLTKERDAARADLAQAESGRQYWMREALGRETDGDDRDVEMRRLAAEVAKLKAAMRQAIDSVAPQGPHRPSEVRMRQILSAALAAGNDRDEAAKDEPKADPGPYWYCEHCGDSDRAEKPYVIGDSEPCECGRGVARVMTLKDAARIAQRIALGWKPQTAYSNDNPEQL